MRPAYKRQNSWKRDVVVVGVRGEGAFFNCKRRFARDRFQEGSQPSVIFVTGEPIQDMTAKHVAFRNIGMLEVSVGIPFEP